MNLPYTGRTIVVKLYHHVLDIILPRQCLVCSRPDSWLCQKCMSNCLAIMSPTCPFCDRLSPLGKTCSKCKNRYVLNGLRSIWYYKEPAVSLVKKIKYHHQFAAVEDLMPRLVSLYRELPIMPRSQIIITSVPSHTNRLSRYGYNQSEILAKSLAKAIHEQYQPLLKRTNTGSSQTNLGRADRFLAAETQYKSMKNISTPATIVIIDDVVTTGATLATCAKKLKRGGAKSVWALTIAKD